MSSSHLVPKDGIEFASTTGIAIIDLVPSVGHVLEGFTTLAQQRNMAMTYMPIFTNSEHQDWFETFWMGELGNSFQKGELVIPNVERLGLGPEFSKK